MTLKVRLHGRYFLAPATQRVAFHRTAGAEDKNAHLSRSVRQRIRNLIPSANLLKVELLLT